MLACVGGAPYPPRFAAIGRLYRDLAGTFAAGRTLGGCRVLPRRGRVLVCREPEAAAAPVPAPPGGEAAWDNRFVLRLGQDAPGGLTLGRARRGRGGDRSGEGGTASSGGGAAEPAGATRWGGAAGRAAPWLSPSGCGVRLFRRSEVVLSFRPTVDTWLVYSCLSEETSYVVLRCRPGSSAGACTRAEVQPWSGRAARI